MKRVVFKTDHSIGHIELNDNEELTLPLGEEEPEPMLPAGQKLEGEEDDDGKNIGLPARKYADGCQGDDNNIEPLYPGGVNFK